MAIRVYQIAQEYSRSPEEVISVLNEAGIPVASKTAVLDEHALHTVRARYGKFSLTVVEGDHESEVEKSGGDESPEAKAKRAARAAAKKKAKADDPPKPAPKLGVRVIKRHEEGEAAHPEQAKQEPPQGPEPDHAEVEHEHETDDKSQVPKLKLKKAPKSRILELEQRIHKIAEKRQHQGEGETSSEETVKAPEATPTQAPAQAVREPHAPREHQGHREPHAPREPYAAREPHTPRPPREPREPHAAREHHATRDSHASRDAHVREPLAAAAHGEAAAAQQEPVAPRPRPQRHDESVDLREKLAAQRRERAIKEGGAPGPDPTRDLRNELRGNYGTRTYTARPDGPRPQGDRPQGDRPPGDRYQGDRPQGDRPQYAPRPQGDRPGFGPRPQGDRPGFGPRPQGDRPGPNRGPMAGKGLERLLDKGGMPPAGGPGDKRGGFPDRRRDNEFQKDGDFGGGAARGGAGGDKRGGAKKPGGKGDRFGAPAVDLEMLGGALPGNLAKGLGRGAKPAMKPSSNKKKKKHDEHIEKIRPVAVNKVELPDQDLGIIMLSEGVTVKELAEKVNRKAKDVIKRLFEKGILATLNDSLDSELAIEIAKDFGYLAEIVSFEEDLQIKEQEDTSSLSGPEDEAARLPRSPIVTIMGHVDHGKTTLLDAIRSTKVASGEAGGITQHIGAYAVTCRNRDIVFLDTPGHEAFTKMRARGASVTDIVILVVAADDGVKPQTIEAISHAKAAKVPIIVCINKIDKPDANPDRVKQMLTEHELVVEDFGGDSPCVLVSAKAKRGIDELLEMILLVADLNNLRANPTKKGRGTVIEAQLDRGRGPVASLIVQDGCIKVGDYFITGSTYGKIRAMHGDLGQNVDVAGPSTPVEILGIQEVPAAGDSFQVVDDEATARQISSFRKEKAREDQFRRQKHTSLDQLFSKLKQDDLKELCLILKSDVQGSLEGLAFALSKLESEKVHLRFIHQAVGNITENDVLLAAASDAIIIGFNVKTERKAQDLAEQEQVDLHNYSVIYDVVNQIEAAMLGLIAPTYEEREIGKAYVKQVFPANKLGKVAGCQVESGVARRDAQVKVMRGQNEIFRGKVQTLRRFRDDVNEVKSGFECGIGVADFNDFAEQDQLVFFTLEQVMATKL